MYHQITFSTGTKLHEQKSICSQLSHICQILLVSVLQV